MLQARISSPHGSLYFAAEPTPYDLEHLRAHVHALCADVGRSSVTLSLAVDGDGGPAVARVAALAQRLTHEGVLVRVAATIASHLKPPPPPEVSTWRSKTARVAPIWRTL